jgi:hypothetical protein
VGLGQRLLLPGPVLGEDDLGFNCQLVQVNGETLRFTSDQGQGIYADLTLR